MKYPIDLTDLLSGEMERRPRQRESFSLFALDIVTSLTNRSITPTDAIPRFFHAKNCRFVRKLKNKFADQIMGRGVQLPDLFDVLPRKRAMKELERELAVMRTLCIRVLGRRA